MKKTYLSIFLIFALMLSACTLNGVSREEYDALHDRVVELESRLNDVEAEAREYRQADSKKESEPAPEADPAKSSAEAEKAPQDKAESGTAEVDEVYSLEGMTAEEIVGKISELLDLRPQPGQSFESYEESIPFGNKAVRPNEYPQFGPEYGKNSIYSFYANSLKSSWNGNIAYNSNPVFITLYVHLTDEELAKSVYELFVESIADLYEYNHDIREEDSWTYHTTVQTSKNGACATTLAELIPSEGEFNLTFRKPYLKM